MTNNKKTTVKNQVWNSLDLIKLSQSLGEGYLPGLDNAQFNREANSLTISKLIEMNKNLDSTKTKAD
jgi:hypothetical protein